MVVENNFTPDWSKSSLIPVVVQEESTKEVLMLAYMNEEAYTLTLQTGYAHYYSRSKQRLWKKGEESGHYQHVKNMYLDCDDDTLLIEVSQDGVACHTGRKSCFYKHIDHGITSTPLVNDKELYSIIDTLYHTILERKNANPQESYVAKLISKGENSIGKKVIEEAGELVMALKDGHENEIIYETADLVFHILVALGYKNISPDRIKQELQRREGVSGIAEKASRKE